MQKSADANIEVRLIKFIIETDVVCAGVVLLYERVLFMQLTLEALILLTSATRSKRTRPWTPNVTVP